VTEEVGMRFHGRITPSQVHDLHPASPLGWFIGHSSFSDIADNAQSQRFLVSAGAGSRCEMLSWS
jgi:hypothetical protein